MWFVMVLGFAFFFFVQRLDILASKAGQKHKIASSFGIAITINNDAVYLGFGLEILFIQRWIVIEPRRDSFSRVWLKTVAVV